MIKIDTIYKLFIKIITYKSQRKALKGQFEQYICSLNCPFEAFLWFKDKWNEMWNLSKNRLCSWRKCGITKSLRSISRDIRSIAHKIPSLEKWRPFVSIECMYFMRYIFFFHSQKVFNFLSQLSQLFLYFIHAEKQYFCHFTGHSFSKISETNFVLQM